MAEYIDKEKAKDEIKRMRMFHEQWEWAKRLIEEKMEGQK